MADKEEDTYSKGVFASVGWAGTKKLHLYKFDVISVPEAVSPSF